MFVRRWLVAASLANYGVIGGVTTVKGELAVVPHELGIKYMRDSEEYAVLARQVYRLAAEAVTSAAKRVGRAWCVVVDVDETALDNSQYELELVAYGLPFDPPSWEAWVQRREAGVVPGATDFVATVRRAGGRIAWISNRDTTTTHATRANLARVGLWNDDDRLCLQDGAKRSKAIRRAEVMAGQGACGWTGLPMAILAFVGDHMGDFPEPSEQIPNTGSDAAFGKTCFLLPNSMYGDWTTRVTRFSPQTR